MNKRSLIWQLAAQETDTADGTAKDTLSVTQPAQVELSDDVPSDGVYQEPDLMSQFKGSVTTMLVLEDMQAKVAERIAKGEVYCKEHKGDLKRFKLLQSLYMEQADLETRIKLEAKIQGELEAQLCDVGNQYVCAHCFEVHDKSCQCLGEVAS